MLEPHTPLQTLAFMLIVGLTVGQCQEIESRRAVTEHQLMHDRGRTMQSLKRLIWLSSAMEGLHNAQARSAPYPPAPPALNHALVPPAPAPRLPPGSHPLGLNTAQQGATESQLRDFFNPHLSALPKDEP